MYEAIDKKTGQHVAIKIVRKFELSQIQVIITKKKSRVPLPLLPSSLALYNIKIFFKCTESKCPERGANHANTEPPFYNKNASIHRNERCEYTRKQ